jgi:hypothetical protein
MKILPVGAELFHADGQADKWTDEQTEMNLIVGLLNFFRIRVKKMVQD